ncbi:AgmX/PglI C-terminal domain-containing protein [Shewanella maritima]|uniref:AgmX/PglI C-terminal domain-containing protein n=1 Tax=Shewanella maritima TaxID=2520507 RepID=UPI003736A34F
MSTLSLSQTGQGNQFTDLGDLFKPSQQDKRFKQILIIALVVYLIFAIVIPMLEQVEIPREVKEQVPPQLAKIMLQEKQLPPPEKPKEQPKPEPEPEPEDVKPEEKPKVIDEPVIPVKSTREVAKEKAQNAGLAAMKDELFTMRDAVVIEPTTTMQASEAEAVKVERKMLAAQADAQSQVLAKSSVTQTVSSGELSTKNTQQIRLAEEEVLASAGAIAEEQSLASKANQRSEAAIRRTLEANKSRLYALYNRALRKDPFLKGKVMFEIDIQPSGKISRVNIKSSELNNSKLERQLTVVLRSIEFSAEDVAAITTIWSIDFLPS